ncbi:ABC transporter substrate-binding protein [Saccharopolyspora sp. 6M]|uniref:ABC transporter substrate-binding protein n=1 Tax=Saccharopolyspora sp. 6M TaxID=2877237 RepID=UPI001CD799E3|nr:ABC transporter substrate-binding protein [Saccharopolyspora sp. 6M]MCA1225461.1 ABC transporter substrate-binding protein [Saccharopolyspora sp. 6M]
MIRSRRELFRLAGIALGAAGTGAVLGGCASGAAGSGPVPEDAGRVPRRGGVLRAAFGGAGAAESLDPFAGGAPVDLVRSGAVYDTLFVLHDGTAEPALALGLEVAADARSFTLRLRDGVRWHDGSPFSAADVVHSLRYMTSPDRPYPSELGTYFDVAGAEVLDRLAVRVPTSTPIGDPALLLAAFPAKIVRAGASFDEAVGTGPFRVAEFEPGRQTRLVRFDDHWDGPAPVDELVLLSLPDQQAKVNAVAAGQADYAGDIPFVQARAGAPSAELEIRTAGPRQRTGYAFVLNATKAPFDDPRVREAVRLGVDRQALVDTALLGFGVPGNDLFGAGSAHFDDRPPLPRDVRRARELVREAGVAGARVVARSAEYENGYNAATQLFVEQLREIGLDAQAQLVGLAEFFESSAIAEADSVTFALGTYPLAVAYGRLAGIPSLSLPDPELAAALERAMASTAEQDRARAWQDVQDVMFDRGNTVVWGLADVLGMARREVAGLEIRDQAKYPYFGKAGLA